MNSTNKTLDELTFRASQKLFEHVADQTSLDQWKKQMNDFIEEIAELKLSNNIQNNDENETLDPTDWKATRQLAHQILDGSLDEVQYLREKPVWRPIPTEVRSAIENESCPYDGKTMTEVFSDVFRYITPYTRGNTHPRFWGWVMGEGTVTGILAEMVAATMNINAGGCTHSAVLVERTVVQWMRQVFGFPLSLNSGIVVPGTSAATTICLAAARCHHLTDVRRKGIINGPHLIVYASAEVHMCVIKAMEVLGLGSNSLRLIPVDENFRINIDKLKQTITDDRAKGLFPFCIVGSAGTVNTGAFDDLAQLSTIARAENLWFHVDGAFGALVILDPQRRHLVAGIENADSLAFDFHKWLHCPYDAACVLIRDGQHLLNTFSVHQAYLASSERGSAGDKPWFCDLGTDLSRSFRALKVWCTLKEHGLRRLGQKIADNCEQAQYLASLLKNHQDIIRLVNSVGLNIVVFRFESENLKSKLTDELIDQLNDDVLADLQESGRASASTTRFHGRFFIRVCIVSHRANFEDFNIFVDEIISFYHKRVESLKLF